MKLNWSFFPAFIKGTLIYTVCKGDSRYDVAQFRCFLLIVLVWLLVVFPEGALHIWISFWSRSIRERVASSMVGVGGIAGNCILTVLFGVLT